MLFLALLLKSLIYYFSFKSILWGPFILCLVVLSNLYFLIQGYSLFIYQGMHLNTDFYSVSVPVSWISLVNIVAVLVFVQVLDKLVYPWLRRNGYSFRTVTRIVIGMISAAISMAIGMLVTYVLLV